MPRIWKYIRVSTTDQVVGHSLDSQLGKVERFAASLKLQHPELQDMPTFVEGGESAFKKKLENRTKGGEMVRRIQPGDHVVAIRIDRIFRKLKDACFLLDQWDNMGVTLHLVDQNFPCNGPIGRLLRGFLALLAQAESDYISERVRAANAVRAAKGLKNGVSLRRDTRIRGWKHKEHLFPVIRLAYHLRVSDPIAWSWLKIALHIEKIFCVRENRPYKEPWTTFPPKHYSHQFLMHACKLYKLISDDPLYQGMSSQTILRELLNRWATRWSELADANAAVMSRPGAPRSKKCS